MNSSEVTTKHIMPDGPPRPPSLASSPPSHGGLDLLTVPELASLLRLTPKGIYALVEGRRIPFLKVSNRLRFRRSEIERWLDGQAVVPLGGKPR